MNDRTRRAMTWLVMSLVLVLGACSILQFVYNQAPKYFMWRSNRAFHYNDAQYDMAKAAMYQWFHWQRKTQLPEMARFLKRGQTDVMGEIPPALACERRDEMEGWVRAGMDQAAPMVAQVMLTLKPEQVQHLSEFFDDQNEDFVDDFLPEGREERLDAATDFVIKWIKLVYGPISDEQRDQLKADMARLPFDAAVILQQFKRFQAAYLNLLRESQRQKWSQAQAQQRIKALLMDMLNPADPALNADLKRWIAAGCQTASAFHHRTTLAQRRAAAEQAKVWEQDFWVLSTQ
jgi:Family of unknown function (DUF6279)